MGSNERNLGDSLAITNIALAALGQPAINDLPRSRPGEGTECLFARALRPAGVMSVGGDGRMVFDTDRAAQIVARAWGVTAEGNTVPNVPAQIGDVIGVFDGHKLSAYNER